MNVQRLHLTSLVSPAQVWAGLTTECQARVVQLLARLASNLVDVQLAPPSRRSTDDSTLQLPQDPT